MISSDLGLAEDDVAIAVWRFVNIWRSEDDEHLSEPEFSFLLEERYYAHILWSPEGDTRYARHFLQTQAEESLPGLALGARLNFIKGSSGSRVFLMIVIMAFMAVVVALVVGMVGCNFLDVGGHLQEPATSGLRI